MLDVDGGWDNRNEVAQICRASDLGQSFQAGQFVSDCNLIDRITSIYERETSLVAPTIAFAIEVLWSEET